MNLDLAGKIVAITGGSKGIGLACARAFLREGAKVALLSRSPENLADARKSLEADVFSYAVDLSDASAADKAFQAVEKELGPIDILVNSAGAAKRHAPGELNAVAWRQAMDGKFFTTIHAMDAVLPGMAARGAGTIVNVIGIGGKVADRFHLAGGSANAALMLATTGLAAAYASKGIRINGINPGLTRTGRVKDRIALEARVTGRSAGELLAEAESKIPVGRMAEPEEIAQLALILASSQTRYVVGAIVPMDGSVNPVI